MKLIDELLALRALAEPPEDWCQGRMWKPITHAAPRCLVGHMLIATNLKLQDVEQALEAELSPYQMGFNNPLQAFNDRHTHAEVLALIDKAIAKTRNKLQQGRTRQPARSKAARKKRA